MSNSQDDPFTRNLWKRILDVLNRRVAADKTIPAVQGDSRHTIEKKVLRLLDETGL